MNNLFFAYLTSLLKPAKAVLKQNLASNPEQKPADNIELRVENVSDAGLNVIAMKGNEPVSSTYISFMPDWLYP